MTGLKLIGSGAPISILALGAHCDDIEIGCGGTILSIVDSNPNVTISWVVFSSNAKRKEEASICCKLFTKNAKKLDFNVFDFRDGYLPYHGERVKESFEALKGTVNPDLIFTHYRHDLHQDHRLISELTWNTFRNHLILEYEIPKWDGDIGNPNFFIPLDKSIGTRKIQYLQRAYESQQDKSWFSEDLFWSIMRLRGMESKASSEIAEAFYSRKTILEI